MNGNELSYEVRRSVENGATNGSALGDLPWRNMRNDASEGGSRPADNCIQDLRERSRMSIRFNMTLELRTLQLFLVINGCGI